MISDSRNIHISKTIEEGYYSVSLDTDSGPLDCRYYHQATEKQAVIYVGGVGGGFDTPAKDLYPRLCMDLLLHGVSGLRVKFRNSTNLPESLFDVLTGMDFLHSLGVQSIGLVGHSFGGAVVTQAGSRSPLVKTVVTLSTQSFGANEVTGFMGKSIFIIHGDSDEVLPVSSSRLVYQLAPEPKRLEILKDTHHVLDEKADEVYTLVHDWLIDRLTQP